MKYIISFCLGVVLLLVVQAASAYVLAIKLSDPVICPEPFIKLDMTGWDYFAKCEPD